jgi:hypothetical protein
MNALDTEVKNVQEIMKAAQVDTFRARVAALEQTQRVQDVQFRTAVDERSALNRRIEDIEYTLKLPIPH